MHILKTITIPLSQSLTSLGWSGGGKKTENTKTSKIGSNSDDNHEENKMVCVKESLLQEGWQGGVLAVVIF